MAFKGYVNRFVWWWKGLRIYNEQPKYKQLRKWEICFNKNGVERVFCHLKVCMFTETVLGW